MAGIFDSSKQRAKAYREIARRQADTVASPARTGHGAGQAITENTGIFDDSNRSHRQYQAFKGSVYTAIRPIMNVGAAQPFRVGIETGVESERKAYEPLIAKNADLKRIRKTAPSILHKSLDSGNIETLQDHTLLKLLERPNEHLTGCGLKQVSLASLMLTGRFVWWVDASGEPREDIPELGPLRLWYVPRHWVQRDPGDATNWRITPVGSSTSAVVPASALVLSTIADPANPMMPFSPTQSQAASIDADDKILKAQIVSLDNSMRPNLVVTIGKLPGQPAAPATRGSSGSSGRPILTGDQRTEIVDAFKSRYAGVEQTGEPIILDGLVESVTPYMPSPAELDHLNSQKATSERTMHGIGTNEVIAGFAQNANRAGSVVAERIFYRNTLNPLLQQVSEDLNWQLGPMFSINRELKVWIDMLEATDPAEVAERVKTILPVLTVGEAREWAQSGELQLDDLDEEVSSKFMSEYVSKGKPAETEDADSTDAGVAQARA